jgi:hypothetical protein
MHYQVACIGGWGTRWLSDVHFKSDYPRVDALLVRLLDNQALTPASPPIPRDISAMCAT